MKEKTNEFCTVVLPLSLGSPGVELLPQNRDPDLLEDVQERALQAMMALKLYLTFNRETSPLVWGTALWALIAEISSKGMTYEQYVDEMHQMAKHYKGLWKEKE
jgi:hypothetical protein